MRDTKIYASIESVNLSERHSRLLNSSLCVCVCVRVQAMAIMEVAHGKDHQYLIELRKEIEMQK